MKQRFRMVFSLLAMLAASAAVAQPAWKPDKPVELIVTCQPGCGPDIAVRNIQRILAAKARTVVFQSGANAITALLGGHVQVVPASVGLWVGPARSGQARLIAVSAPKRMGGEFADVPTWREQGVDAVVSVWRMITAPPSLTAAQIAYWQDVLRRTTQTPEWKRELEQNYQSDEFIAGAELARTVDALHTQLRGLLTDLDLVKK